MRTLAILCGLLLAPLGATAATITIGHSGANYTTIADAMTNAADGDILEIIDNTATFPGNIVFNKRVTLRGKADLNPRPTIVGDATDYSGVPGQGLTFEATSTGSTVENLIVDGQATDLAVTSWPGGANLTFNNVKIIGPAADAPRSHALNLWHPAVLNNCEINGGLYGLKMEGGGGDGLIQYNHCVFRDSRKHGVFLENSGANRQVEFNYCDFGSAGYDRPFAMAWDNAKVTISHSLFQSGTGAAVNEDGLFFIYGGTGQQVTIDHCDFIGSPEAQGGTGTHNAIIIGGAPASMVVTNCIFSNFNRYWFLFGGATGNALKSGMEDNNVYVGLANDVLHCNADDAALTYTVGAGSIDVAANAPLYVNAAAKDFRLFLASPANRPGVGNYAGSQGESNVWVPVTLSSFSAE